jgi:hypothetical protein
MARPKLIIKKKMLLIQGKVRPCCQAQAVVEPALQAVLDEHFATEPLFKRASYASGWPKGALEIPPHLAPALSTFLKNDACPEITVKTLMAAQLHQGANVWEMMAFEFITKLAFDNFVGLCTTASELGRDMIYEGVTAAAADLETFKADTAAELLLAAAEDIAA